MILPELKKCLKSEQRDKTVFDIIFYGSAAKGKLRPNDIDIIVIFRGGSLSERLDKIQRMKKNIARIKNIDIKGILWEELFQEGFFGRSGVFFEGISIFSGKPFAERIGFRGSALFLYSLKKKTHTEKVRFNYLLKGRKHLEGILKRLGGKQLGPTVLQLPASSSIEFEEILKRHQVSFTNVHALIEQ